MSDDTRARIIQQAKARQGIPYRLDPPPDGINNLDCSLFVLQVLDAAGVPLAGVRTAEQIRQATLPVPFADVQMGDLLFFEGTYDASGPAGADGRIASHIGISLGAGTRRMWDAHEGRGVGETNIGTEYWQEKLFEARRAPGVPTDAIPAYPRGVDVASYQGNPDWRKVAESGVQFAITKATEGDDYLNPTFERNWREIKAAGLKRGAYHYARPDANNPEREATYFCTTVKAQGIEAGDVLALDLEDGTGPLGDWAWRFLRTVQQLTGVRPMLYTGAYFITEHRLDQTPGLEAYPLWLAAYQPVMPPVPAPWGAITIWQHTDKASVPGISGNVDGNRWIGTAAELAAFGLPQGVGNGPATTSDEETILGLRVAIAHLVDKVLPKAAAAAADREAALAEAARIRAEFLGAKS